MVEMARRKGYYFARALYALAILLILCLGWRNYRLELQTRGGMSIATMATIAQQMFYAVAGMQFATVFILVPLFVCGVVAGEREGQTLELLFTTELRDRQIVVGKLVSRAAMLFIVASTALPVLSLIMFFGGIDPDALWRVFASTLAAIVFTGAHAIYFSVATKSTLGALVRTYWWMALWVLALPWAVEACALSVGGPTLPKIQVINTIFLFLNPLFSFSMALNGTTFLVGVGAWAFPASFTLPLCWSLFLIYRAVKRLRESPKNRPSSVQQTP
jgi:ABC-type transport system involved in multi-copper enzyme maturation permease subunit